MIVILMDDFLKQLGLNYEWFHLFFNYGHNKYTIN